MNLLSIMVGKLIILVGKLVNRGSSMPGMVALKINKKIFSKSVLHLFSNTTIQNCF